jgi:glycosyltransferase involved in cell wall biosynthesis
MNVRRKLRGSMKLVVVGPYPIDPSRIRNGVEAVVVYLLDELKKVAGLSIDVISCDKGIRNQEMREFDNIKVHYLPSTRHFGNVTFDIVDKMRTMKKIRELNPDIVHVHTDVNYPYILSTPGFPTLITVHGVIYEEDKYKSGPLDRIRRIPRSCLERIVLRKATHIICVTSYVREMVEHFTKGKIFVVENPVSSRYFEIIEKEISNRILFVGTIQERKNIYGLIKATEKLREKIETVELRVAGKVGEEYYYEMMNNYIKEKQLVNNVRFLGQLSDDELLEEYGNCCVVASLSFEESSGMVIQQAMASGKAAVASRNGGFSCVMQDGETGFLIDVRDIEGFAEKLGILLMDKELRVSLGRNAKREALRRFRADVAAKRTYSIYQKILKNPEPGEDWI